ncbi:hypothetical protein Mhar_1167 [Methanothrix harundinacea 6Ac]|uniref:YwbE family protein n=2 Tax=Methanothrix harundinacea TaxID=301375 RepID=G7WMX0_METH6|nr:YwbE family protein [Methanothrix harundinacea]AET64535.1 hypothetical protein Mhar_1167 [Methanothrix harundinacea 6Ac]
MSLEARAGTEPKRSGTEAEAIGSRRSMDGKNRKDIKPGMKVEIILKRDQKTGKLTEGVVKEILTNSSFHPHGIKVRLADGQVGRVARIVG